MIDEIIKTKKMRGLSWSALAETLPISGNSLRMAFERNSVAKEYLKEINNVLGIESTQTTHNLELKETGTPYYDIDFTASFLEVVNNQQTKPDSYISHPFFKNCDFVVRASGQSMAKVIKHGDAIGLVEIKGWKDFLPLGEIYAIVSTNGFRMIKIISKGETKDSYTLISKPSDNKKDEFPNQEIKKKHILSIFKVQASSHLF